MQRSRQQHQEQEFISQYARVHCFMLLTLRRASQHPTSSERHKTGNHHQLAHPSPVPHLWFATPKSELL